MRAVTRMQLRMTAPTQDGFELEDRALQGEDFFDLGEGERAVKQSKKKNGDLGDLLADDGMSGEEDEVAPTKGAADREEIEYVDSEDEREAKTKGLENELDNLYDDYRERMQSRDNKFKVREARLRDKSRESWKGIKGPGSDEEEEEEEPEEEGGWEKKQQNRALIGEEPDSDDDTEDEEDRERMDTDVDVMAPSSSSRRPAAKSIQGGKKQLLTKLGDPNEISSAAKVWFDQPVFKGLEEFDDFDEDEDEGDEDDNDSEEDEDEEEEDEDVSLPCFPLCLDPN